MNEVKHKKIKKKRIINKLLTILLLLCVLILFGLIFYLNVIPLVYSLTALLISLIILIVVVLLNLNRKRILRILGYLFSIVIIFASVYVSSYLFNTVGFLSSITDGNYLLKNYNVIVLKTSRYKDIDDLNNKTVGLNDNIVGDNTISKVKKDLNKKVELDYKSYEDASNLVDSILKQEIDAIVLENNELELIKENEIDTYDNLKIIYNIEVKNDITNIKNAVNINKEAFNIYISGIDTYGNINSTSRSDVNIVMSINPKDEKILILWIPRDYYVNINNSEYKDKLTHAGIYGINSSIFAVEKLLDTKINYYVKVNFTSVIKVVDILKGITVYNDETFTTNENITFKKGTITLNGEEALSFVRDRKHVTGGDLGRGKNQIKVLEAIMNKAKSPSIIKNYNELLKSLRNAFVTNMSDNTMLAFIKSELDNPRDWQIESITLYGTDSYDYTYSYRNNKLYVMIPDMEAVNDAKEAIKDILD